MLPGCLPIVMELAECKRRGEWLFSETNAWQRGSRRLDNGAMFQRDCHVCTSIPHSWAPQIL